MYAVISKKPISIQLSKVFREPVEVTDMSSVGGGSIGHTYKLQSSTGMFFLKAYDGENASDMVTAEARGLELLRTKSNITIPKVLSVNNDTGSTYLLMDYIISSIRTNDYWQDLAIEIAEFYRNMLNHFRKP